VSAFADFQRLLSQTSDDGEHASVELLLGQIGPVAAKHLRLCAIPHQFNLEIFQRLMPDPDPVEAERRYDEFSHLSLVSAAGEGLAIHDQTRRFLFERWLKHDDDEFREANAKLVDYFGHTVRVQNSYDIAYARRQRMFHTIGHNQATGIREFEAMFREERRKGRLSECETLLTLIREYKSILTATETGIVLYHEARLWFQRRDWGVAEKSFRAVLDVGGLPQPYYIKSWNRIGLLLAEQRNWKEAISALETAVRTARESKHMKELGLAVHDLGTIYSDRGDLEQARSLLQEAIAIADVTKDISIAAIAYNSLGVLDRRAGDVRLGIQQYTASLKYLSAEHEPIRTAQVYNNLGSAYADIGEWQLSREMYTKSMELKTNAGDTIGLARTLSNLVAVYGQLSLYDEAISAAKRAINIFEELRDHFSAAVAARNLAKLYRAMNATEDSRRNYSQAVALFHAAKDPSQEEATQRELDAYVQPVGLPWWAWTSVVLFTLVFVGLVATLLWLINRD
jgi:tetratricopeptide (TPR) repeat protein